MNRREKMLAYAVGLLVVVAGLNYGIKRVIGIFTVRSEEIATLTEEINGKEVMKHRGTVANRLLEQYRLRSLPSNSNLANSRYRAWLHEWCEKSHVSRANVKYVTKQIFRDSHERHTFSVTCEADLPRMVNLLYDFYQQDYLHRIKYLKAKPGDDNSLGLTFTIEAVAMPDVDDKEMQAMPSRRLASQDLDDYLDVIVARNLYSPANQPPKFTSANTQTGYVDQRMSFSPKVDDPEKGKLTYHVDSKGLAGLSIDEKTGKIEWTPDKTGEFEILVYAVDDGLPAKETSQSIQLAVSEPPPPSEEPPPRPTFDEAKYTFVTAIVEVNQRRQVWLTVRTEGKWLRLFEGETFQIGSLNGKIVRIYPRHVEILADTTLLSVRYGESLGEGKVIGESEADVASADN